MNQTIQVNFVHHPFDRKHMTICEVPYRNQNLAQLKEQVAQGQDVYIGVDRKQVEYKDWERTWLKPQSKVVLVSTIADPATLGYATWSAFFWATAVNMAIAFGLAYLGGVLFGPDAPSRKDTAAGQSFSWAPQTTMREGGAHPLSFGKNMHHGNVVARWTDVDGSGDEILYMILDYGQGPIKGKTGIVYLDDQPSTNYSGVSIQERLGTLNQTAMSGFEQNKLEYSPGWEITHDGGPVIFTTPNNFFDDIGYTLELPGGLYHYHKSGGRVATSVAVKVEISERDAGIWTTLFDSTIGGNSLAPIYKAYVVNTQVADTVEHGKQYELKITKVSADSVSERHMNSLILRRVREVVDVPFTRPGKALIGITALATNALSGRIDVRWEAEDKIVNTYNGTTWILQYSRNRAWVTLAALTQPVISGDNNGGGAYTIERYEGIDPSRLDLAFFYEWASWCDDQVSDGNEGTEDRMTCDTIIDYQTDVWSLMYEIAQVGRMYPYWQGNTLTGWVDKVDTDIFDLITFDNIMVRSWKSAWAGYGEMAGGCEVFYQDALHGYERTYEPVPNENAGAYNRIVAIEGIGVKGAALATRVGNHAMQRSKLIKNINSVRMYKDALRYRLGKVVRLQSNVANWGASYRVIKSQAANTVVLDRICTASPADIVYIRSYDTANKVVVIDSYTVASVVDKVVTIEETWDVTPIKNNILAIGVAGAIKLRRITEMKHTVDNYFDVTLETYDATLFDSDSIEPNIDNPVYAWPQPASPIMRPLTVQQLGQLISQRVPPEPDIDIPWPSNLTWTGSGGDTCTWSKTDGDETIQFRYRGTTYDITPDDTTDLFIYWDPNFTTIFKTTNTHSVALAAGNWLMCVNVNGVVYPANAQQLVHGAIIQAGTITAAYAQIGDLAVDTLQIQNNAVTLPVSAYTAAGWVNGDVQEVEITTTGAPLIIIASVRVRATGTAEVLHRPYVVSLKRDAGEIYTSGTLYVFCWGTDITGYTLTTVAYRETPGAGTYTYKLNLAGYGLVSCAQRFLFVMETKK